MGAGQPNRLRAGLPAWLGGAAAPVASPGERRRGVLDDVAAWLEARNLDPTPANYAVAHAFVTGQASAEQAAHDAQTISPELLTQMAEALEDKLAEALGIVGQQAASARSYGDALDNGAREAEVDPIGAFNRLIDMTRDVVAATRAMEDKLETTRRDAAKLRSDLNSARRAADRDHLTGLPNRRFFDARLAGKASANGCLALCDIDDFKRINDAHGHETGDRVLRFVAKALKEELKGQALVARFGGEEFACLFDSPDTHLAVVALDRMRTRLKTRSLVDRTSGVPIGQLTFSAGVTKVAGQPRVALRAADEALYAAKRGGKDRIEVSTGGSPAD